MRRVYEPCRVDVDARAFPKRIQWRERFYFVEEVEDFWREQSRWWAKPEKRTNFRVRTKKQQVMLVHVDHDSGRWTLAGFYD